MGWRSVPLSPPNSSTRDPRPRRNMEFLIRYLKQYSKNPTPFTRTKGPEHFQQIIEATRQYQAAHPKQTKQRKDRQHNTKN